MRANPRDLLVAGALQFARADSVNAVAKRINLRPHELQYSMRRLLEQQIIRPWVFVNPFALGLEEYEILFTIGAASKNTRAAFDAFMKRHPAVIWFGSLGGEYQYGVRIAARRARECADFLEECQKKFGSIILRKAFSNILRFVTLPKKYLAPGHAVVKGPGLILDSKVELVKVDEIDRKIIIAMMKEPGGSEREVSRITGYARNTIHSRIENLKASGVLLPEAFLISASRLGYQAYRLIISARGLPGDLEKALQKIIQISNCIVNVTKCLGEWDFELGVEVQEGREASELVSQVYEDCGACIDNLELLPVFSQNVSERFLEHIAA